MRTRNARREDQAQRALLDAAVNALQQTTGLQTTDMKVEGRSARGAHRADAELTLQRGAARQGLTAEIRAEYTSRELRSILDRSESTGTRPVLVTHYVTPGMAEILRREGIEFVDTAGNAFLDRPGMYVFVKGMKAPGGLPAAAPGRLFQPAGLRVIFVYLARLGATGGGRALTVTELAQAAGVSLGSASQARQALLADGYLEPAEEGREMVRNRRELLERWVRAYGERLRPKTLLDRLHPRNPRYWQQALHDETVAHGGETAVAKLLGELVPAVGTLYVAGWPKGTVLGLGLTADPQGTVEVREMFWHDPGLLAGDCVPPLLIYADLLATDNPRNLEAAEQVYAKYLAQHLESH